MSSDLREGEPVRHNARLQGLALGAVTGAFHEGQKAVMTRVEHLLLAGDIDGIMHLTHRVLYEPDKPKRGRPRKASDA